MYNIDYIQAYLQWRQKRKHTSHRDQWALRGECYGSTTTLCLFTITYLLTRVLQHTKSTAYVLGMWQSTNRKIFCCTTNPKIYTVVRLTISFNINCALHQFVTQTTTSLTFRRFEPTLPWDRPIYIRIIEYKIDKFIMTRRSGSQPQRFFF